MIIFIASSFEFFVRGDQFLGAMLLFNGAVNLLAYQQIPKRVALITVLLNLFNCLISITVSYNYGAINYTILFFCWTFLSIAYIFAIIRQLYSIASTANYRKKQKKKAS
jgi:hypothetical protein